LIEFCVHSIRSLFYAKEFSRRKEDSDMPKTPKNQGKQWTPGENKQLRKLVKENTPTRVAGLKLGRTPGAAQQHANDLGLSMKPTNQSPYSRRKK
jgi:hypothetical protein